jgi:rubrerythrin
MVMNMRWTLEKALDLALNMEKQSIQLYTSAQDKALTPGSKKFLEELVEQERKYEQKIPEIKMNPNKIEEMRSSNTGIDDLKIVDRLEDISLSAEASYQQILIYAGKREKSTHDFYVWLANLYSKKNIGKVFAKLALEELKHKYLLEKEYDDIILKWM